MRNKPERKYEANLIKIGESIHNGQQAMSRMREEDFRVIKYFRKM